MLEIISNTSVPSCEHNWAIVMFDTSRRTRGSGGRWCENPPGGPSRSEALSVSGDVASVGRTERSSEAGTTRQEVHVSGRVIAEYALMRTAYCTVIGSRHPSFSLEMIVVVVWCCPPKICAQSPCHHPRIPGLLRPRCRPKHLAGCPTDPFSAAS